MNKLYTILALGILACGPNKKPQPDDTPASVEQQLRDKAAFYLSHAELDSSGWAKETACDGLLFNSLYAIGGGHPDPTLARGESGVWYRTPSHDCYPNHSGSSISRDQFMGLIFWIWENKRRDLIEEIINYGENHENAIGSWVMGEGDPFAIGIRLEFQADFYEVRYRFGGSDHGKRKVPQIRFPLKGYEDHLQMLDILLRALMIGSISDADFKTAKKSAEREPRNALFQAIYHRYADGDYSSAIKVLLDETLFPSGRMPSASDRCEAYLWQRDSDSKDWLPCPASSTIFSGIDYLFVKAIILNEI
jgi:hypothetical protein